ncbi:MAG TPA: zf-HC2 domain-containing protein [Acidimicrobiales bacterium]|jgi:anti-sigma factor RsiW|nr:zf-HC2 domain-containing protein [Acidimicrobiales bacterium]
MRLTPSRLVCQQAVELASDYLEGSLSRRDRRRLERHLAVCDACTTYLEQLRITIAASGSVTPDELAPEVLDTLTELFRKFHEDE